MVDGLRRLLCVPFGWRFMAPQCDKGGVAVYVAPHHLEPGIVIKGSPWEGSSGQPAYLLGAYALAAR